MRPSFSPRAVHSQLRPVGRHADGLTFADAVEAGAVTDAAARAEVDLRADDWPIRDQGSTGVCVGFAAADGVPHWHYRQAGLLAAGQRPSPQFIWMGNKETDLITSYPTTFIESAGTQHAVRARKRWPPCSDRKRCR